MRLACRSRRSRKRRLDFIPRQRFWQNFPLPRRLDVQRGIVLDGFVEQQISIQMTQRGKLPSHAASVDLMGEELLQEFTNIIAPRSEQCPFSILEKFRELNDVGRVGGDRKREPGLSRCADNREMPESTRALGSEGI